MREFFFRWLITAFAVFTSTVIPGIKFENLMDVFLVALVLGVLNALIRPALLILSLPLIFLTLGLFTLVINVLMFKLAAWLVPGFSVSGFFAPILGSLLVSLVSFLTGVFMNKDGGVRLRVSRYDIDPELRGIKKVPGRVLGEDEV